MLSARERNTGATVIAWETARARAPFSCPECAADVTLKQGTQRVHHFAHKPPVSCEYGVGESEAHRACKAAIYRALADRPNVTKLALERDLGTVRPDVSACIGDAHVAIEVQISSLSLERIAYRTAEYARKRVHVLWCTPFDRALTEPRFSPRVWMRWLHATYFGRVYFWVQGDELAPFHFGPHLIDVEHRSWYDEYGDEQTAGGYARMSRRYREPQRGRTVAIARDFVPRSRAAWSGGTLRVPDCRLYMDAQPAWWSREERQSA